MCDHSNDPGGREAAMVDIAPGVHCDPCIAALVKALHESDLPTVPSKHNPDGIRTVASCCGHGKRPGNIVLADGRVLVIHPDLAFRNHEEICKQERQRVREALLSKEATTVMLRSLGERGWHASAPADIDMSEAVVSEAVAAAHEALRDSIDVALDSLEESDGD